MSGLCEIDLHRDTPVEILHSVLLGPIAALTMLALKAIPESEHQFCIARINGLNKDGIFIGKSGSGYVNYVGSLHARDFKALMQIGLIVMRNLLINAGVFGFADQLGKCTKLWMALAKFGNMLYVRRIPGSVDEYCTSASSILPPAQC